MTSAIKGGRKLLRTSAFIGYWMIVCYHSTCLAQEKPGSVHWMTFEELDTVFDNEPKKVLIDFYADWCGYCVRMDRYVFTNPDIVALLNAEYYAVRMDAETKDSIRFAGKTFVNRASSKEKKGFHELAIGIGKNDNGKFSLPTIVILDRDFNVSSKHHQYLHSKKMLRLLKSD